MGTSSTTSLCLKIEFLPVAFACVQSDMKCSTSNLAGQMYLANIVLARDDARKYG